MNMRLLRFLLLLALAMGWPLAAQAQSCSTSAQPLAFGATGSPTVQRDTTANLTVTCTGAPQTVRVCVGINAGSATGSTLTSRLMSSGANTVGYQITTSPGGATWGDDVSILGPELLVTIGSGGSGNAVATMYGRVTAGQSKPTGIYSSTLTTSWRIPSGGSSCGSNSGNRVTGGSFTASVTLGGTCTITAAPIDFGTVANLIAGVSANGALSVTCSNALPYTIALNAGSAAGATIAARKMSLGAAGGPGVVSYQLYQDGSFATLWGDGTTGATYPGTGTGSVQSVPVYGRVPGQATPSSGTYKDTVTATITY